MGKKENTQMNKQVVKNTAVKEYDNIIKKKPTKIMKLSNTMNIITICCLVIGIIFLILDLTKIYTVPPWLFWSPLIIFGISFVIVIINMMRLMLKDGFVKPKEITKSTMIPTQAVPDKGSHSGSKKKYKYKKKKKKKKKH